MVQYDFNKGEAGKMKKKESFDVDKGPFLCNKNNSLKPIKILQIYEVKTFLS